LSCREGRYAAEQSDNKQCAEGIGRGDLAAGVAWTFRTLVVGVRTVKHEAITAVHVALGGQAGSCCVRMTDASARGHRLHLRQRRDWAKLPAAAN